MLVEIKTTRQEQLFANNFVNLKHYKTRLIDVKNRTHWWNRLWEVNSCRFFSELNVPIIDADEISHYLAQPGQPTLQIIASIFGAEVLHKNGELNRAYLKNIFSMISVQNSNLKLFCIRSFSKKFQIN